MKHYTMLATALGAVLLLAGCHTLAGQPRIAEATMTPPVLEPDSAGVIRVKVDDPHGVVDRVEGVIAEDDRIVLPFHDDGEPPDEVAGDGVWSIKVEVPFEAPPGDFTLLVTAYREDGLPVTVRRKGEGPSVLSTTVPVQIRYREDDGTGAAVE